MATTTYGHHYCNKIDKTVRFGIKRDDSNGKILDYECNFCNEDGCPVKDKNGEKDWSKCPGVK